MCESLLSLPFLFSFLSPLSPSPLSLSSLPFSSFSSLSSLSSLSSSFLLPHYLIPLPSHTSTTESTVAITKCTWQYKLVPSRGHWPAFICQDIWMECNDFVEFLLYTLWKVMDFISFLTIRFFSFVLANNYALIEFTWIASYTGMVEGGGRWTVKLVLGTGFCELREFP